MENSIKKSQTIQDLLTLINVNEEFNSLIFKTISEICLSPDNGWYHLMQAEKIASKNREKYNIIEAQLRRFVIEF